METTSMVRRSFLAVISALPLLVAGCSGGVSGDCGCGSDSDDESQVTWGSDPNLEVPATFYALGLAPQQPVTCYYCSNSAALPSTALDSYGAWLGGGYDRTIAFHVIDPAYLSPQDTYGTAFAAANSSPTTTSTQVESFPTRANPGVSTNFQVPGTKYHCRLAWEKHNIHQCINRNVWHINVEIKDNSVKPEIIIFNVHIVHWWENGPQMGIYVTWDRDGTRNRYCRTTRGTYTELQDAIYEAINRDPVPSSSAWVITLALTPIVYAVILIPK